VPETVGYIEELPPHSSAKQSPMEWPFKPRQTRRLTPKEAREVKSLLLHVKAGNISVESIAEGFGVGVNTVKNIQAGKTFPNLRPSRHIARPQVQQKKRNVK
jgi:hypothetical protein